MSRYVCFEWSRCCAKEVDCASHRKTLVGSDLMSPLANSVGLVRGGASVERTGVGRGGTVWRGPVVVRGGQYGSLVSRPTSAPCKCPRKSGVLVGLGTRLTVWGLARGDMTLRELDS